MKYIKPWLLWGLCLMGFHLWVFFSFAYKGGCPSGIIIPGLMNYPLFVILQVINKVFATDIGDNVYPYLLIGGAILYFLLGAACSMLVNHYGKKHNAYRFAFGFIIIGIFMILFDIFLNMKRLLNFTEIFISILGILSILVGISIFIRRAIANIKSRRERKQ